MPEANKDMNTNALLWANQLKQMVKQPSLREGDLIKAALTEACTAKVIKIDENIHCEWLTTSRCHNKGEFIWEGDYTKLPETTGLGTLGHPGIFIGKADEPRYEIDDDGKINKL